MAVPAIGSVNPVTGPTAGVDVVRITDSGFAAQIAVLIDDSAVEVLSVRDEGGIFVADVRTPAHVEAVVDVTTLRNLGDAGAPVPGEEVVLSGAYRSSGALVTTHVLEQRLQIDETEQSLGRASAHRRNLSLG